jgi:alpha-beta hydrolase superfamily lysophospholipase
VLVCLAWLAGCATPVVQQSGAHLTAPRLEAGCVIAADGAALPLSVWRPHGAPRAVVLALHGFNDHRLAFAEVGPFLAAGGIVTYAYDQRGFGATAQRGIWPGSELLADDARAVAALLRQRHPGQLLYLLGESMGGAVAMSVLAETPEAADGAVLSVPALVLYGERDEIIPRRPTCRMLSVLASSARIAIYPDGYHMLTRDLGARVVLEDVAAWLADPAAPLPSGLEANGLRALCGEDACPD